MMPHFSLKTYFLHILHFTFSIKVKAVVYSSYNRASGDTHTVQLHRDVQTGKCRKGKIREESSEKSMNPGTCGPPVCKTLQI